MNEGIAYSNDTIHLDGEVFLKCSFSRCTLVYSGGTLPKFDECTITNCAVKFDADAERTMMFLKFIYHGIPVAGEQIVKQVFNAIKEPPLAE